MNRMEMRRRRKQKKKICRSEEVYIPLRQQHKPIGETLFRLTLDDDASLFSRYTCYWAITSDVPAAVITTTQPAQYTLSLL